MYKHFNEICVMFNNVAWTAHVSFVFRKIQKIYINNNLIEFWSTYINKSWLMWLIIQQVRYISNPKLCTFLTPLFSSFHILWSDVMVSWTLILRTIYSSLKYRFSKMGYRHPQRIIKLCFAHIKLLVIFLVIE